MSDHPYASGNEEDFVSELDLDDLRVLGKAIIERMKEETGALEYTRCPVCNKALKNWHQYGPSWTMVQICLDIIRVMSAGHTHVHIKADLQSATTGHENHTIVGRVVNNYSKMAKLGLIAMCEEDGGTVDRNDPSVRGGKHARFTITKDGYDFVMGKKPLSPAKVRVKNDTIIDADDPEIKGSSVHVNEVRRYEEDSWLDATGKYTLPFPEDLLPPNTGFLFEGME